MRNRQAGFSVFELLIIGAIISILAAIAIYSYMNALNRAKQKRTVNDIRVIALAWEARAVDTNTYAVAGFTFPNGVVSHPSLVNTLRPTYLRDIPQVDGWGRPLEFGYEGGGRPGAPGSYGIRSPGRDGLYSGRQYAYGSTGDPDCDIVWSNGTFVAYPDTVQGQ